MSKDHSDEDYARAYQWFGDSHKRTAELTNRSLAAPGIVGIAVVVCLFSAFVVLLIMM